MLKLCTVSLNTVAKSAANQAGFKVPEGYEVVSFEVWRDDVTKQPTYKLAICDPSHSADVTWLEKKPKVKK